MRLTLNFSIGKMGINTSNIVVMLVNERIHVKQLVQQLQ